MAVSAPPPSPTLAPLSGWAGEVDAEAWREATPFELDACDYATGHLAAPEGPPSPVRRAWRDADGASSGASYDSDGDSDEDEEDGSDAARAATLARLRAALAAAEPPSPPSPPPLSLARLASGAGPAVAAAADETASPRPSPPRRAAGALCTVYRARVCDMLHLTPERARQTDAALSPEANAERAVRALERTPPDGAPCWRGACRAPARGFVAYAAYSTRRVDVFSFATCGADACRDRVYACRAEIAALAERDVDPRAS